MIDLLVMQFLHHILKMMLNVSEKKITDLQKTKESEMAKIKLFIKGSLKVIHYHVNIFIVFVNHSRKIPMPLFGFLKKAFQCFNFLIGFWIEI